jgi:hypothetical protein
LNVKTLLEAGFLSRRVRNGTALGAAKPRGSAASAIPSEPELAQLARELETAWRTWWRGYNPRRSLAAV